MSQKLTQSIHVGIDIGSTTVRCVVGVMEEEALVPSIIGVGSALNSGMRKGVVVDIEETVTAITAALDEAERISGIRIGRASIGVNGAHIKTFSSHGVIAVGGGREISVEDVARVEEAASLVQLPPNREILLSYPRSYSLDGQENVQDPVGMSGMRLEVDTTLVTAATPFLKNLHRSVNQAGISINSIVANPIAAAQTVPTKKQIEVGTVVVDIGHNTTGLAVYEENELLHVAVVPIGSGHLTNDLAIGLRTDIDAAERLKLQYSLDGKNSRASISIEEISGEKIKVSREQISEIVDARLEELFEYVNKELARVHKDGMLPGGAVLTGGGANLNGVEEAAKNYLRLSAHKAHPKDFSGILDKVSNPAYSTAVGLMLMDIAGGQSTDGGFGLNLEPAKLLWQKISSKFQK